MEVVATIVGKIWDCTFDATCRQFCYLYHFKDSVERLRIKAEKLEHTRERVQGNIDEATTKGEIILSDVTNWIQRVDGIAKEAEHFRDKRCLKGLCINPWSRYRLGKEAERRIEAISILQQEGAGFESVSRQAPPPRNILIPSSDLSINFQSRELITRQIMETLEDENVSIIGICGMGGVGKTTLANEISKQAFEKKIFDFVVMVAVSQTLNYFNIQRDIAQRLGFKLRDDDESARAHFLLQRIMEKLKIEQEPKPKPEPEPEVRILIILDDVWEGIELGRVGIPFSSKGCKIVLTSRIEDVCAEMNARTFKVGTLGKEESWGLFRDVASGIVDNPDINPIAREVADECGGLPLALVTVAAALKNRKKKSVWIDAKQQLKKSAPTNLRGMDLKVFANLKLSYDFLASKEEQSVFLLCCLFPQDFNIPIELLMKYGMGLRLFQEVDTVEEARCRIHALVSTLIASFLLIPGNSEQHVKMHDIVRDFAIKLSKDEHVFLAKAGLRLREWPSAYTSGNLTGISLMYNDISEVPDGLEYPKLQALLLQGHYSLVVSNNIFQGMRDLKVLDMSRIQILPHSLLLLANLTTLHLDDCKFGDKADISFIGRLTNLEILSLNDTDIAEIPGNFGQLVKLKMFYLKGCFRNIQIPQAVISCLKKLEDLHVSTTSGLVTELQVLSRKTILHVVTEDAALATLAGLWGRAIMSNRLPFLNSTSFVIEIGCSSVMLREQSSPWSRILYLAGFNYQELDWAYSLTKITDALQLNQVAGLRNILTDLGNHGFNDLKFLQLLCCTEIKYLVNTLECTPKYIVFNSLESLWMKNMNILVEICHGPLPAESFRKLKQMHLSLCSNMFNIVPSDLLQRLHSLESFEASGCLSVVYVFDFASLVIAKEETKFLSSLNHLKLAGLINMIRIWNGDARLISLCNLKLVSVYRCFKLRQVFPPALLQSLVSLEHMEIINCNSLEEIFGKEEEEDHQENEILSLKIDHTATSPYLGNLVFIKISGCHKLKSLFTPSIAKGLVQLRTLKVELCGTLEEIISDEKAETGGSTDRITFPGLYQIDLGKLRSLTCFCARRCTIEFPALELLDIQKCPKMETFGRGDQVTPKLVNMIHLDGLKRWKDNLNITLQQFFKEKQWTKSKGLLTSRSLFSDFGDENFAMASWEKREVISRGGYMKLQAQVFFASIDQRSERAAGDSACTALVAIIANWLHSNRDEMPIKSEFDSLIREGSLAWRNLCEKEDYIHWFPDKHFDLETVLQAKICPLCVVPEKSFIGFFHPEGLEGGDFDFLHSTMSFDNIWEEIDSSQTQSDPLIYIISWNDHFFLLKVEQDAYYIIDTLGERLSEGCNQAYVLKFDKDTTICQLSKDTKLLDEKSASDNKVEATTPHKETSAQEEVVVCRGKDSCKEYIKNFLAAIPIRELQDDIKKGLMASTLPHHRLQIEFYCTHLLQPVVEQK